MNRFFVLALAVGFGLSLIAPGIAAGQDAGNTPTDEIETETPAPTETPTPEPGAADVEATDYNRAVDRDVTIERWQYNESRSRFVLDIHVVNRSTLTIAETRSQEDAGTAEVSVFSRRLSPGSHRITMHAEPGASDEAIISLQTPRSINQGRAIIVSTGYVEDDLPFEETSSTTGWIGGAFVAFSMTVLAGVQSIKRMKSAPQEV